MTADVACAPANAEELFRAYSGYICGLVQRLGVPSQEAEDVAADILARLYERDIIGMFDPDHHIERNGSVIPARFKSFLSHHVALYVRGKRDALARRSHRELLIIDQPTESGGSSLTDLLGGAWDDYSHLEAEEFVIRTRNYLAGVAPRNARDKCSLVDLFDEMVREFKQDGVISYATIQERFGISSTSVQTWVGWLRECLSSPDSASYQTSTYVIGGVILSDADIASAVRILRQAKGVMVRQPLERASHKLAAAYAGWYHELASQELTQFPELGISPGSHKKPKGHVKTAVLHRLDRMLGWITPEPDPEPEVPSAWDDLEAKLWRGGLDSDQVSCVLSQVQDLVKSGEERPA